MPHFIIDCSEPVLSIQSKDQLMKAVHEGAQDSGLFGKGAIKVRIRPFSDFIAGDGKTDFLHVFAHIMEGRSEEQKAALSQRVVKRLKAMLPTVSIISMNVIDLERATYSNRSLVD